MSKRFDLVMDIVAAIRAGTTDPVVYWGDANEARGPYVSIKDTDCPFNQVNAQTESHVRIEVARVISVENLDDMGKELNKALEETVGWLGSVQWPGVVLNPVSAAFNGEGDGQGLGAVLVVADLAFRTQKWSV